eukprot:TRINITY_DN5028_c0_g2_i1.p1 TRINITY_DN5028_c0_g2~~TRINITY_DN5028_c0_g2_i1.p1  ORF type:complete len:241 (+),score=6.22 TRINITY_DN5028_c0_g2_i1:72-725(+)
MAFRLVQRSFKLCLIQLIMLTALRRDSEDFTGGRDDLPSDELIDMPDETMMRQPTAVEALPHRVGKGGGGGSSWGGSGGGNTSTARKVFRIVRLLWAVPEVITTLAAGGAAVGAAIGFAPDAVPFVGRRRAPGPAPGKPQSGKGKPHKPSASASGKPAASNAHRRRWKYGRCTRRSCPTGACCKRSFSCHRCKEKRSKRDRGMCRLKGGYVCATEWF